MNNSTLQNPSTNVKPEKRRFIIYKATSKLNGKIYIGQTAISLKARKDGHAQKVNCGSLSYFHNAIRKNGMNSFTWEKIFLCSSKKEANAKEREFILVLKTKVPHGYNLTSGGEGTVGFYPSEETRAKMGKAHRGNKFALGYRHSEEAKNKISQASKGNKYCLGHCHSDETKAKVSASLMGNKRMVGFKMPDETKAKISMAMKGKRNSLGNVISDETKAKISKALKGRKKSDETRAKMSKAMTGIKRKPRAAKS